jgi:hypothetical protein
MSNPHPMRDAAREILFATRTFAEIRDLVMSGASPFAVSRGMRPLPPTTPDTVALRSGLRLGILRNAANA